MRKSAARSESPPILVPGGGVDIGLPRMTAKDGYLTNYFITKQHLAAAIQSFTGPSDPRLRLFTHLLISDIVDDERRRAIYARFTKMVANILKNPDLDADDKSWKIVEAIMVTLGDISAYYDEYLGVSTHMRLMPITDRVDVVVNPAWDTSVSDEES